MGSYSPHLKVIQKVVRGTFKKTNNEVEYEAMIPGLLLAKEMNAKDLIVRSEFTTNCKSNID